MDYATIASRENGSTIDQHYHISINSRGEVPALWLHTESGTIAAAGADTRHAPDVDPHRRHLRRDDAHLYVDGQQVATQAFTGRFVADTTPFILGANGNGAGDTNVTERFPGRIDEIMLYRRALSAPPRSRAPRRRVVRVPARGRDAGARD